MSARGPGVTALHLSHRTRLVTPYETSDFRGLLGLATLGGMDLENAASAVLRFFPSLVGAAPRRHRGGFSGACVWQVHAESGTFCLRAWPPGTDVVGLRRIHELQRLGRVAGLAF